MEKVSPAAGPSDGASLDIPKELESLGRIRDRLLVTSQDKMEGVLRILLPKLIVMADTAELRTAVEEVIGITIQRIKDWKIVVHIEDLFGLVCKTIQDTNVAGAVSSKLAIAVIDAAIDHYPKIRGDVCIQPILSALKSASLFSVESDSLCHYATYFLDSLSRYHYCREKFGVFDVLGDWFLDNALLCGGLSSSAVGAVRPGLSTKRLQRLTMKTSSLSPAYIRTVKLDLIATLSKPWLPRKYCVAIVLACCVDPDEAVAMQAVHKVRGAKTIFDVTEESVIEVLGLLLSLCSKMDSEFRIPPCEDFDGIYRRERTAIRTEVAVHILHFIKSELFPSMPYNAVTFSMLTNFFTRSNMCSNLMVDTLATTQADIAELRITASILTLMEDFHDRLSVKCEGAVRFFFSSKSETSALSLRELRLAGLAVNDASLTSLGIDCTSYYKISELLLRTAYNTLFNMNTSRVSFISSTNNLLFDGVCLHCTTKIFERCASLAPSLMIQFPLVDIIIILLNLLSQYGLSSNRAVEGPSSGSAANEKDEYFVAAVKQTSVDSKVFHDAVTILLGTLGTLKQLYVETINLGRPHLI
jgi:hypothetical protein